MWALASRIYLDRWINMLENWLGRWKPSPRPDSKAGASQPVHVVNHRHPTRPGWRGAGERRGSSEPSRGSQVSSVLQAERPGRGIAAKPFVCRVPWKDAPGCQRALGGQVRICGTSWVRARMQRWRRDSELGLQTAGGHGDAHSSLQMCEVTCVRQVHFSRGWRNHT